jgi:AraC-like DNA-binding protein
MNLIEPLLRGAGLATALTLVLVAGVRGGWRLRAGLLLMLACVISYLACSSPALVCGAQPAALPLLLGALAFPFAFWRLASVVLEDDRRVPWFAWVGLAAMVASGLITAAAYLPVPAAWRAATAGLVHKLVAIAFLLGVGVRAWRSREGDLVEPRRRLRWLVIGGIGLYSLVVTAVEIYLQRAPAPLWLDLLNVALIDLALLGTAVFLLGVRPDAQEALFEPATRSPAGPSSQPAPPAGVDVDAALVGRLTALMQDQHLYRDPELSVRKLADTLQVPEYVLRRLILARLGHRHFASFVNDYRLREVVARLQDPALERRPILTLALEAGFGSIGPFNRLFRETHGMTPSAYRESTLRS